MLTFPIRLAVRRPHPPTKWARLRNAARKSPICPHPCLFFRDVVFELRNRTATQLWTPS